MLSQKVCKASDQRISELLVQFFGLLLVRSTHTILGSIPGFTNSRHRTHRYSRCMPLIVQAALTRSYPTFCICSNVIPSPRLSSRLHGIYRRPLHAYVFCRAVLRHIYIRGCDNTHCALTFFSPTITATLSPSAPFVRVFVVLSKYRNLNTRPAFRCSYLAI